ncbi:sortilin-related receptor [Orussus abietinus]|uniref:sortilin-related receptor n=1 Tax=Orussus abietinus TaxID=222816 RepID=UPI0006260CCB|nr:sortilin-related receptor [Orussus abietinus]
MAARAMSAFYHFLLILQLFLLINYNYGEKIGDRARTLHLSPDEDDLRVRRPLIINRGDDLASGDETSFSRMRRDVPEHNNPNITTKINALNDSHQQLMVHWVGEGSDVIICLAKDSTLLTRLSGNRAVSSSPSAVYISYNYGDTFENKTKFFKISREPNAKYASVDKFYNHPKFTTDCVFADNINQLIFVTMDNGKNIIRHNLQFHPSEISFHDEDRFTIVVLDKTDPMRKLWYTENMGTTWVFLQEYVKAFSWIATHPRALLVERAEPTHYTTVLKMGLTSFKRNFTVVIRNVEDFQVRGDYMFGTRKADSQDTAQPQRNLDLYISYKRQPFVKARFNTELDKRDFHIVDVSYNRIFVAVSHSETVVNLYVSEVIDNQTATFTLSLERILTYFPNSTWKDSWLSDVAEEPFTDLYKVEGLRGIYIASHVKETPKSGSIGPEHLVSLITYDHGATWNRIKHPEKTSEGFPIACSGDCSLHLTQKFSQLYPVTRSVSIMSSKSAPGIIMATGVIGRSLKGHPALYVSRDAGLTWKQVLKDYYFFNMGDHGGVLVAVKYFKSRGETRDISYSVDEGETWQTYVFNEKMLKVYGLMTEPGENTTVFTMFGSGSGQHQWLIMKVDLRNVFERNCTEEDFKFWSPTGSDADQPVVACVLGRKETYQRRAARAKCYTGANYDRPIKVDICQCDANDYQCDFGFVRVGNPYHCVRNKSISDVDPYAVPSTCAPGKFYNRTKGYVKIPDDDCSGGFAKNFEPDEIPCPMEEIPEFLLVAQRDQISRIDLNKQQLETLPVHGLKNVIAIEFDLKNNCLYWADIVNDTIGRQCLQDGTRYPEILVETDLSSIEGMALDWVSNVLYFVDGVKMKIEIIRTDISSMGRMRRTILSSHHGLKKPRGIAVHPMMGYMFWTDWAPGSPSVSRANLDGTDIKRLFTTPTVEWPNGITIDHIAERIYWVDARGDYIGLSDFDGKGFKKIISEDERVSHPFAVAVFKDNMYWDDWKQSMIFEADKDHGFGIAKILGHLPGLMDLKVFAHSVQTGTNMCANNTCSHICLGAPNNSFVCLCPEGMEMVNDRCMCPGMTPPYANATCPRVASTCSADQFACANNVCIPQTWKCDEQNDCGDNSDEVNCNRLSCPPDQFECDSKCIPKHWVCDGDRDCKDGRDETNCTYINCTEFRCDDGRCLVSRWRCDGEIDCRDGSDEIYCTVPGPRNCSAEEFSCKQQVKCIDQAWVCDGNDDCEDGSDETDCQSRTCQQWQFTCDNHKCIPLTWRCDGAEDCADGSDEANCTTVTPLTPRPTVPLVSCNDWMFKCSNKKCVPYWWKCDSVDDCGDNSDEMGCGNLEDTTDLPNMTEQPRVCREHQFQCYNGECIEESWVCDGSRDCQSGEDELHCDGIHMGCREDQFMCRTDGSCVPLTNICNGVAECPDSSDELGCHVHQVSPAVTPSCSVGLFPCDETRCFPLAAFCDGKRDCVDETDESHCDKINSRVYQVLVMGVDERSINATSLFLFWWMPIPTNVTFEFLPSIAKAEPEATWKNATDWIEDTEYQFNDLEAYTRYNLTVYVRLKNQTTVFPPAKYLTVMTGEGVPSEPWNVTVTQKNGTRVEVSWRPPLHPNGPITGYEGFITPPIPPMQFSLQKTSVVIDIAFEAGKNYSFWVIAKNRESESKPSNIATLTFDGSANIDDIEDLRVVETTNNSVTLAWKKVKDATGYNVTPRGPAPYPTLRTLVTTENTLVVNELAPGINYTFEVNASKKNYFGKGVMVVGATKGVPLPSVVNLEAYLVKSHGTSVKLTWDPPKSNRKIKWQYAIHYALNMQDLFREPHLFTTNKTTTVRDLEACESYVFAVGIRGSYGAGPLSQPVTVTTHFNARAPPKRLRVSPTDKSESIIVSWSSSCPTIDEPISYTISITEMTLNIQKTVTLPPTNETTMKYKFTSVQYGGKYNITISTDVDYAIPSKPAIYLAPPILPPHQLNVLHEEGNYILYWQERGLPDSIAKNTKYHYEILVNEDSRSINESTAMIFKEDQPPYIFPNAKTDVIYSFAVRLVTEKGYKSLLSEVVSIESPSETAWQAALNTSNILSFAIPVCLLIVALGAVLGYYVIKHRRLSNSFTQFANSHYDTRRGQATFPGTADGLDEEDSPVIRGFSDDEPLVIA